MQGKKAKCGREEEQGRREALRAARAGDDGAYKAKQKKFGRQIWSQSLTGVGGLHSLVCTADRRQSSLLPTSQLSDLLLGISEGSRYSRHSKGRGRMQRMAEDMKSCS